MCSRQQNFVGQRDLEDPEGWTLVAQTVEANLIFSGHENRGKTCNYAVHRVDM